MTHILERVVDLVSPYEQSVIIIAKYSFYFNHADCYASSYQDSFDQWLSDVRIGREHKDMKYGSNIYASRSEALLYAENHAVFESIEDYSEDAVICQMKMNIL